MIRTRSAMGALILWTGISCLARGTTVSAAGAPAGTAPTHSFFALCHDTHDAKRRTLEQQAALLAELGYDGAGHLWLDHVTERLETLDRHGLRLFQIYVRVSLDPSKPKYDPRLADILPKLRGRDVVLGVLITGMPPSSPEGDSRAVAILREMADLAEPAGVRLAIYPHHRDWTERVADAVRVARKVDRTNVGVMFNLCHWLRAEKGRDPRPALESAMPHLFVVTINGADGEGEWDRLIQPLGSGSFDVCGLLATLGELGYTGPIGLQCYGIAGDVRDTLERSMKAWREYSATFARSRR